MKRLIISLLSSLSVLFVAVPAMAATSFWTFSMENPAATTNKTIKVNYNVQSTDPEDTFTVELFENNVSKGTQSVTNPRGDSGVFTVNIPAAGTYTYKLTATNHGDGNSTKSDSKTVQVSNAPEPTVNTITVNQAAPANAAGGGAGAGGAGGVAAAEAGGQVAAAAGQGENGAVTDQAANTAATANQDVLGAEASTQRNKNRNNIIAAVVLAGASLAGYAYYRLRVAPTE